MSSSEQQPKSPITLFLDATHQAKITAKLLRDAGVSIEVHKRYFLADAPDPEWIAECTERGWVIISGDKGIQYDGVNRRAVITSHAKVFILSDTTSRCVDWAAALVVARHKILKIADENNGPFYCKVEKCKDENVSTPHFLEGGGPIPKAVTMVESQIAVPDSPPLMLPPQEDSSIASQGLLNFTNPTTEATVDREEEILIDIETRNRKSTA